MVTTIVIMMMDLITMNVIVVLTGVTASMEVTMVTYTVNGGIPMMVQPIHPTTVT